ncbi:hypothetical protein DITRI_Ditri10aG0172200 [Diplodiscus trichospermus]
MRFSDYVLNSFFPFNSKGIGIGIQDGRFGDSIRGGGEESLALSRFLVIGRANARRIGEKIGRLVRVDESLIKEGIRRGFLRIRLGIKIEDPLIERFWIPWEENEKKWIIVKYEKLADFCYACRKLGH